MIRVQILNAENLPVPTKNERKTKIFCFSTSSCNYIYDSFKNDENTKNPKWNESIDIDLFRCSILIFRLYSSRLFSKNIFLGDLNIDFSTFLIQSPGNEILKQPYGNIRCEFPLTSCNSPNAKLYLSFLYLPKIYRPIQFKDISNPIIHLFATCTPPIEGIENNIEIELLQTRVIKNSNNKNGFYFNLNNRHSWESVGYSSSSLTILGPSGFTPIRSFFLERINNTFNFFIVNVSNYSGIVTLNFIIEKRGDPDFFDKKYFISPIIDKKNSIGTVKTVEIKVEPHKKYCAPIYLFYVKKFMSSTFIINQFPPMSTQISQSKSEMIDQIYIENVFPQNSAQINQSKSEMVDQISIENPFSQISTQISQSKSKMIDQISSESPFYSSIIQLACGEIGYLKEANIMRTLVLPKDENVSIQKVFNEFNLQQKSQMRIYISGSTTTSEGQNKHTNFWRPYFIIFDSHTGQTFPEITKKFSQKPLLNFNPLFEKNEFPVEWHTYVDLDLNEIGIDKVVVFSVGCLSYLNAANPPGMISISAIEGGREIILFRNPVYVDSYKAYWTTFMRFEFIENDWNITQMRYAFNRKKKLEIGVNTLFNYNWEMPEKLFDESECTTGLGPSDEEFLLNEI